MLKPRIIVCLDYENGQVVKGVRFGKLRNVGSPADLAQAYAQQGADEIVMLDVSATRQGRLAARETVREVRRVLSIPLSVGGGVSTLQDAEAFLNAGADRVCVNSAAVARPELIRELASRFGQQCIVVSIDARIYDDQWEVVTRSGSSRTQLKVIDWASQVEQLGAGEILLTSWDRDGTRSGFDTDLLKTVAKAVSIPIVASGGGAHAQHVVDAFQSGAQAVLAASIFHDGDTTVASLKQQLAQRGVEVRL